MKSYGSFQPTNTATTDEKLIYEIGSVTKVFTGITLARLVNEGQVKLSDPLSVFVPNLPADLQKITLVQLATHTSGLPRLPNNLEATIKNQQDPYANYTSQDLLQSLAASELESKPGRSFSYSNLGMGLLGHLLSDKAKQPYAQLVETTVTQPLRMKDTTLTLSQEQEQRLVKGHEADGKPS